jgi:hypothetical protein
MMIAKEEIQPKNKTAKTAGLLYLLVIVFGMFAELYVNLTLIVPGDAQASAQNILASEFLYRIGFMSGLLHHTSFLMLVLVLYRLFKPVNKNLASMMSLLGFASVPIMMLNMLNQFAPLILLSGADYLEVFSTDQLQTLVMLFLDLHNHGYFIAGLFSGLFLLPLGLLVLQADYFPRFLGVLLVIGCFGYLLELVVVFLVPDYEVVAFIGLAFTIIAEFSFTLWLLLKGIKIQKS